MRLALSVALAISAVCAVSARQDGIEPLIARTATTAKTQAVAKDASGGYIFAEPNMPMLDAMRRVLDVANLRGSGDEIEAALTAAQKAQSAPFYFEIDTPYSDLFHLARETDRKFDNTALPPFETINKNGIRVSVTPASSISRADTIENVVIQRGANLIHATTAKITPTVARTAMGASIDTASGVFWFDASALDPSSPIVIVFIGKAGNFEWPMTAEDLARLK